MGMNSTCTTHVILEFLPDVKKLTTKRNEVYIFSIKHYFWMVFLLGMILVSLKSVHHKQYSNSKNLRCMKNLNFIKGK